MFELIAFDADDTLWQNERLYARTLERFVQLLSPYVGTTPNDPQDRGCPPGRCIDLKDRDLPLPRIVEMIRQALFATEMRNLEFYGYGIKSFTLSMIETAIALSESRIAASEIRQIIGWARDMLQAEVQLLPYAEEAVAALSTAQTLMLLTKGDLLDQQRKLERSGLGKYFDHVEIVSHKTSTVYRALLDRHQIDPQHFMMVGNSLRSDILPVTAIGASAVYVPQELTWDHEMVPEEDLDDSYYELEHLGQLAALVERIKRHD